MSTERVRIGHFSLQAQDSDRQHRQDAIRLVDFLAEREYAWATGTEAGGASDLHEYLATEALASGFRFSRPRGQDCWVMVNKDYVGERWEPYFDEVIAADGKKPARHTAKGVMAVTFDCPPLKRDVTVIAEHGLTRKNPGYQEKNRRLARATYDFAEKKAHGRNIVVVGSDTNINDKLKDVFFGEDLTTIGDELKKWVTTGHGPIDVIATMDMDKAVTPISIRDVPDKELFLHSDHEGVEAVLEINVPRRRR